MEAVQVIIEPVLTEKANQMREGEAKKYVFKVHPDANKIMVKEAVNKLFGVKATACNIVTVKAKPRNARLKRRYVNCMAWQWGVPACLCRLLTHCHTCCRFSLSAMRTSATCGMLHPPQGLHRGRPGGLLGGCQERSGHAQGHDPSPKTILGRQDHGHSAIGAHYGVVASLD